VYHTRGIWLTCTISNRYIQRKLLKHTFTTMPKKQVKGEYQGHTFEVLNTWRDGLKLFHNGELIEHNKDKISVSKNKPLISKTITIDNKERTLEVLVYAVFRVKIQIRIDGEKIAGDKI
jgi:hypothetical protein